MFRSCSTAFRKTTLFLANYYDVFDRFLSEKGKRNDTWGLSKNHINVHVSKDIPSARSVARIVSQSIEENFSTFKPNCT